LASASVTRARSRRLALTPPAMIRVLAPVWATARRHLITMVSTTASSKARAMSALMARTLDSS